MKEFDLVIIGGGPAGYTGAIRAAQLGMSVACIESRTTLGGTCLNEGCIPSKALLNFSHKYEDALAHFKDIGIEATVKLNLAKMLEKKNQVVQDLCKGIGMLFNKNKVTLLNGMGRFKSADIVEVVLHNGTTEELKAKNVIIATGSKPLNLPNVQVDEKYIVSSTGALDITSVPKKLAVIGGGYIGLELGSVWRRLGSEVTVIEFFDRIVPALDTEICTQFSKILEKQGIKFKLKTKVNAASISNDQVKLELVSGDIKSEEIFDKVLVSVGRKPYTDGLCLDKIGITVDDKGRIPVNKHYQTNVVNIRAVGDVITGPMLAHKAEEEAVAAVELIAGQAGHVDYNIIPSVVYTHPEVASVGITEDEAKTQNIQYKVGKFPFLANSRARSVCETDGFVKIISRADTDEVIGAHIIGPEAGTLIAEVAIAMEFKAAAEDIARTCHAHPTLNEAVREAALAVDKRAINC